MIHKGKYQSVFNTASNHITFVGKVNPVSGETLSGTCLLSRNQDGKGNTFRPQHLRINKHGKVFLAARSWYSFPSTLFAPGFLKKGRGIVLCVLSSDLIRKYSARLLEGPATNLFIRDENLFCCGTNWISKFDIHGRIRHKQTDEYKVHELVKIRESWRDIVTGKQSRWK